MNTHRLKFVLLCGITALSLLLPSSLMAAKVLDRIVAVVNEDIILLSELNQRMKPYIQKIQQQGYDADQERELTFKVREDMLNRLVDEKLTDQEIKRNDIQVDEAQLDAAIERIKTTNYFTDEDLQGYLKQENITMQEYRDQIKEQIMRSRLVNYQVKSKIVVTEKDILDYYDGHPELYGGKKRFHLKNILLRVPELATTDEKQAVRKRIEDIRQRIANGESFSDQARSESEGPAAANGGDIGDFEASSLSPQILDAIEGLSPGDTTAVLDTDLGFQLFYLDAVTRDEGKSLESVKDEIHERLYQEEVDKKFLSWLEELRGRSHIKVIN